jgi:hypothetical protein
MVMCFPGGRGWVVMCCSLVGVAGWYVVPGGRGWMVMHCYVVIRRRGSLKYSLES